RTRTRTRTRTRSDLEYEYEYEHEIGPCYRRVVRALLVLLAACAPQIDGPIEHQRALNRDDAARLAVQLAELPGALRADVTLHRPVTDPLSPEPPPAGGAIVIVVDDHAARAAIGDAARRLAHATAPEIPDPAIAVELGATRPELAHVG